jgi:hypothetical protein
MPTPRVVRVVKVSLVLLSLVLGLLIFAFVLEVYYKRKFEAEANTIPMLAKVERIYGPSDGRHIHPVYLFFYPYDQAKRRAINNPSVTIDVDGFRGPGPSQAGSKKLAFITGGSGAFGYGSTSDATTISGFLNQLQSEYFFVNAAVSSWVTTQELERVAFQLLDLKPALIVSLNGFNDILSATDYRRRGKQHAIGIPEFFDTLYGLVGDIESSECKKLRSPWYRRWYPNLSLRFLGDPGEEELKPYAEVLTPAFSKQIAQKYAMNLNLMHAMTASIGARYIGAIQPIAPGMDPELEVFMRSTTDEMAAQKYNFEFHNFRDVMTRVLPKVPLPVSESGEEKDAIFVDAVHLTDAGAKIVAEQLLLIIRAQPDAPPVNPPAPGQVPTPVPAPAPSN